MTATALLVSLAGAAALYAAALLALAVAGRAPRARALVRTATGCAVLVARLARDPAVPPRARLPLILAAAYLACPLDLVPDVVPVIGHLDDALVVALALLIALRAVGPELIRAHWPGAAPPAAVMRLTSAAPGGVAAA